jgi:hypothetical protein
MCAMATMSRLLREPLFSPHPLDAGDDKTRAERADVAARRASSRNCNVVQAARRDVMRFIQTIPIPALAFTKSRPAME